MQKRLSLYDIANMHNLQYCNFFVLNHFDCIYTSFCIVNRYRKCIDNTYRKYVDYRFVDSYIVHFYSKTWQRIKNLIKSINLSDYL